MGVHLDFANVLPGVSSSMRFTGLIEFWSYQFRMNPSMGLEKQNTPDKN